MTPARRIASEFAASRIALAGLALLALVLVAALLAPWISPQNPYDLAQLDLLDSRLPPGARSAAGAIHWLGTDDQGRDMLSAILYGLRTSVAVGLTSTAFGLAIGVSLGLAAAWFGGSLINYVLFGTFWHKPQFTAISLMREISSISTSGESNQRASAQSAVKTCLHPLNPRLVFSLQNAIENDPDIAICNRCKGAF